MMKNICHISLLVAGLLSYSIAAAQTRVHWAQLGANFGRFNDLEAVPVSLDSLIGTAHFNSRFVLGGITPGWAWSRNDRLFSSISLEELNQSKRQSVFVRFINKTLPQASVEQKDFRLRLRFGLEAHIHQNPQKRLWVFLSCGADPYWHRIKTVPLSSLISPNTITRVGLGLDGKAGVLFALTDRIRCEASACALASGFSFYRGRDKNARLSSDAQKTQLAEIDFRGEAWWWKIGVSYQINDSGGSVQED